ncbi:MAG: hypothetical protein ACJAYK_001170 [Crocinitomicaceae bacterium]|jgi:hypothetical protein
MYKVLNNIFIVTCFFATTACSSLSTNYWYQSTDVLIEQGEFNQALKQLKQDGKNKQYEIVRNRAIKDAYKKISRIEASISKKKWAIAKHKFNKLYESHPPIRQFTRIKNKIDKGEKEENRKLQTKLALAKIQLLNAKQLNAEFNRRRNNINSTGSYDESLLKKQKLELAQTLYTLSLMALEQQDYFNAQKTYNEAIKISPKLSRNSLSIDLQKSLEPIKNHSIKSKQDSLYTKLNDAIASENFDNIITLQKILSKTPFEGKKLKKSLQLATKVRLEKANFLDKQADTFYRGAQLTAAIDLWRQAKLLNPENRNYYDKLARASKVQSKLIRLRKQTDQKTTKTMTNLNDYQ